MTRAMWSGSISFGLVNIPVKLYPAIKEKRIRFHRIHGKTGARVQQKLVLPDTGEAESGQTTSGAEAPPEIDKDQIVKGYEFAPGNYVPLGDEELKELAPEQTHTIEIETFVELSSIDPVFFNKSYWVIPSEYAVKPYALLFETLSRKQKVAIGRFVMKTREYLAVIRPASGILCLETMFFADEVVSPEPISTPPKHTDVDPKELGIAERLVDILSGEFKPEEYRDLHMERLQKLIEAKIEAQQTVEAATPVGAQVQTLLAALEKSLRDVKKDKGPKKREQGRKASRG